ncbi:MULTISPECIES: hypothetical protein [unclassified Sphingomonas]|uniref:hypothetical protein n=1 Tax=unclassified Sphingomonas TaxID=196159 RepID=UPI000A86BF7E|nr:MULTISPECIES: hypothetical protein [unclassified Sphingomonas]
MRSGFLSRAVAVFLTAAAVVMPAQAQQKSVVKVSRSAPYRHPHSKIELPVVIDRLPRVGVEQLGTGELDTITNYETPDHDEVISVFVYRDVLDALPVWFDRAIGAVEGRSASFGAVTPVVAPQPFTPPGRERQSGLIAAWRAEQNYRSTGLAMFTVGEWLVKLRYSSRTIAPEAMGERMQSALAAIKWPKMTRADRPAEPVAACPEPLVFADKPERVVLSEEDRMASALASGVISAAAGLRDDTKDKAKDGAKDEAAQPARWCRDPAQSPVGAVYRPDASTERYLIALSDAGRGIVVSPDLSGEIKTPPQRWWSANLLLLDRTLGFAPYSAMPTTAQAIDSINGAPIVSTTTFGKKRAIDIITP